MEPARDTAPARRFGAAGRAEDRAGRAKIANKTFRSPMSRLETVCVCGLAKRFLSTAS
jgi:hypothetical protein